MTQPNTDMVQIGQAARAASRQIGIAGTEVKNRALLAIAEELERRAGDVLAQNARDLADGRSAGLSEAMLDRLSLNEKRIGALAADARRIATLPDPVGAEFESRMLPNGLHLSKRRIPIGVIGVIYEARPNVTLDVATLCLKTGNAAILRGGSETRRSNLALTGAVQAGIERAGLPGKAVQYIADPDRARVTELLRLDKYVDMIIPRGGAALHRLCREQSTIPVITGGMGICHVYVDASADLSRAVDIVENAKVQRPSVCNALDTVLIHRAVAEQFLPKMADRLAQSRVELRASEEACRILESQRTAARVVPAGPDDFDTEWLALILGVKVVGGLDEAIEHVQEHSTEHSDSILTNDLANATRFVNVIDSAAVFVNASTRFNDGGEFGLGAEVAVSTQKLHARGPMGLEELTTYKWVVFGSGQIRQ